MSKFQNNCYPARLRQLRSGLAACLLLLSVATALPCAAAEITSPGDRDVRIQSNQFRLQDINRDLENTRPASPAIPGLNTSVVPGTPAEIATGSASRALNAELRGNLHRLQRETQSEKSTDSRDNAIEESLDPNRGHESPGQEDNTY